MITSDNRSSPQFAIMTSPTFAGLKRPLYVSSRSRWDKTYSLLCQLPRALVLGVSEQFNDTALVGGETGDLAHDIADERGALAEVALGAGDTRGGLDRGDLLQRVSAIFLVYGLRLCDMGWCGRILKKFEGNVSCEYAVGKNVRGPC
jgi:hypothetical protein